MFEAVAWCELRVFKGPTGRYGARFEHAPGCAPGECSAHGSERVAACGVCANVDLGTDGRCRACDEQPFGWRADEAPPLDMIEIKPGAGRSAYVSPFVSAIDAGRLLAAL